MDASGRSDADAARHIFSAGEMGEMGRQLGKYVKVMYGMCGMLLSTGFDRIPCRLDYTLLSNLLSKSSGAPLFRTFLQYYSTLNNSIHNLKLKKLNFIFGYLVLFPANDYD